jgi:hypothetical protein
LNSQLIADLPTFAQNGCIYEHISSLNSNLRMQIAD